MWRSLRRLGVPERDVADAAQHVFLTFCKHADEIEGGKEPAYLASVAVRVAANARRKLQRSREDALGDEVITLHPAQHTPEELASEKQLREELDRGLLTLPFDQRTVFVLYELEGFTLPQVVEAHRRSAGHRNIAPTQGSCAFRVVGGRTRRGLPMTNIDRLLDESPSPRTRALLQAGGPRRRPRGSPSSCW